MGSRTNAPVALLELVWGKHFFWLDPQMLTFLLRQATAKSRTKLGRGSPTPPVSERRQKEDEGQPNALLDEIMAALKLPLFNPINLEKLPKNEGSTAIIHAMSPRQKLSCCSRKAKKPGLHFHQLLCHAVQLYGSRCLWKIWAASKTCAAPFYGVGFGIMVGPRLLFWGVAPGAYTIWVLAPQKAHIDLILFLQIFVLGFSGYE
nr:hypothetical protein Iba_chr09dCG8180 [Ipomoea batatas]